MSTGTLTGKFIANFVKAKHCLFYFENHTGINNGPSTKANP